MAGRPLTRARIAAQSAAHAEELRGEGSWHGLEEVEELDAAPVLIKEAQPRVRACAQARAIGDLHAGALAAAQVALEQVNALLADPSASGREIRERAVTFAILTDKAAKLEDADPEPTTGAADLEQQADEIQRLRAELARRDKV